MQRIQKLNIKAAILDMDGVLWKRKIPLVDLPALFSNFKKLNINVMFATNNGTSTVGQYVNKFSEFGVQIEAWQIVTSAMATGFLMQKDFPKGGPVFISGSQALIDTLKEYGFYHSEEEPVAVAAGLLWDFGYESVKDASLMIQKGLPFYFTNPDPTYPTPTGFHPGAGTVLAALETASGIKAKIAGKPMPFVFEYCLEKLGVNPQETLVIGDRLTTDIQGGQASGCKTALVLTGINSEADLESWSPKPDLVIDNVSSLFDED